MVERRAAGRPRASSRGRGRPSDKLWDQLRDCHRQIRAELREVVRAHGLYLSEYRALARLGAGPLTSSQLAEGLGLTPASMTDLGRQLLARGWVVKEPHPHDGRSHLLRLTLAGRAAHLSARREYRERLAQVYAALSPEARRALAQGLLGLERVLTARQSERIPQSALGGARASPRAER